MISGRNWMLQRILTLSHHNDAVSRGVLATALLSRADNFITAALCVNCVRRSPVITVRVVFIRKSSASVASWHEGEWGQLPR